MIVLLVGLHMLSQALDALRQDGNLHGGGAGVPLVLAILPDELCLAFLGDCHVVTAFRVDSPRTGTAAWPSEPLGTG